VGGQPIRVLIADDESDVREALGELLAAEDDLEVVALACDADEAVSLAAATAPDVALVDVKMPGGGGAQATREIGRVSPRTRVLALSAFEDRDTVLRMLGAGVVGYLVKGTPPEDIVGAISRAVRGQTSISSEVIAGVVDELSTRLQRQESREQEERDKGVRIRAVIDGDGLSLVYQPIFRLRPLEVVGFEALARFPQDSRRPPIVWFREASDVGLDVELELVAIRAALGDLDRLPTDAYLSLNLSHRTARSPRLLAELDGAPLHRVVIEITEHEAVDDYEVLAAALGRLRASGARIAIDDAGAGFASLRHTLLLEPDIIKLDISLTRGIDADRAKRALARALISFAEEMRIQIVAEGIETPAELETLLGLGAGFGQGFYLARPAPLEHAGEAAPDVADLKEAAATPMVH
jgi:EAL domain-containing protein (putative c-di-GMP-specific phosphodiesterase class I)/CheY-like chemotaxis protein